MSFLIRTSHAVLVISVMLVYGLTACGANLGNGESGDLGSNGSAVGHSVICQFHDDRLTEISGLAASIQHPGLLWTHNDSGDSARVFAIDAKTCDVRAEIKLAGVSARDVEAIAVGTASNGQPVVWVGDIGDNTNSWPSVRLYRFNEPARIVNQTVPTTSYTVRYGDGPHNGEGLLVDPAPGGSMWIVTKSSNGSGGIYALPANFVPNRSGVARKVGSTLTEATDAAYSPDRSSYAIRGYFQASMFTAPPPGGSARAIDLALQPQGEAMTFSANSQFLYMAGEKSDDLWTVPLPDLRG